MVQKLLVTAGGQDYLLLWAFQDHWPLFQAVLEAAGVQEHDCHWLREVNPQIYGDGCLDLCDGDRIIIYQFKYKRDIPTF